MPKPLLSIGIIFKNEIRCLERCLASLTPLREAVPCELIVADTGSDDGSREIAEKYADVVFDFPWINDFSAARNAVMDRCSGRWYLTLDADEWLDSDIKELTTFLRSNNRKDLDVCSVLIRNYAEIDDFTEYNDFLTIRMLRMSTGIRYEGAVHEMWRGPDDGFVNKTLSHTILHHDGYVGLNEDVGRAKRQRNQALLEELLKEDPDNVRTLLQYIESSRPDPQHLDYLRRGLAAVEGKKEGWQAFGPPVYRYAVLAARNHNLPEEEEWTNRAVELFPDSFYSRIDIAFLAFIRCWENKRFKECIPWGEMYMAAIEDYDAGRGDQVALRVSTLLGASHQWRQKMYTSMAVACREEGQPGRAVELLEKVEVLTGNLVGETLKNLQEWQVTTDQDTAPAMLRLYQRITEEPDERRAKELMDAFLQTAPLAFGPDVREKEAAREDFHRHGYTLYVPLAGKCETGTAAAVMEAEDSRELDRLLGMVENWGDFSVSALIHALEKGAAFPPSRGNVRIEEMDRIAKRLAQYKERFFRVVCQGTGYSGSWRELVWTKSMAFAAVWAFDWSDQEQGMALAEAFAKAAGAYVSRCYTQEVLCEENIGVLPPVYRFGWYSGRAFQALESGDAAGYVRLLRAGLETCPEMKIMVEFLTENTPQLRPSASQELLSLAEQVRKLLAAYDPDDPAVASLKQSPVYQKVAHLIEGLEAPVMGGLPQ